MKNMKLKKITAFFLALVTLACIFSVSASASSTYKGTVKLWGVIRYYNYKVYKDDASWYRMTKINVTPTIYHTQNTGSKNLAFTIGGSYSSETAKSFSSSIGCNVGFGDAVTAGVNLGLGLSKSKSFTVAASGTVGSTVPASARSGYYKMTICYNFNKLYVDQYRTDGTYCDSTTVCLPVGNAYVATLYSSNNTNWARY
ncbi:MAG: hypothetical protein SPF51_00220 [Candidatus Fimivicinus sp.]|nr:hypothetical protein [Oscillospiraceae bacterium]MDY5589963.1 hypothetical protein [Candidatus Fimivicinus sp.]